MSRTGGGVARSNFSEVMKKIVYGEAAVTADTGSDERVKTAGQAENREQEDTVVLTETTSNTTTEEVDTSVVTIYPSASGRSITTVAADTVIIGEMHVKGDLNLLGGIKGDVFVNGDIRSSGKIVGDVKAENMVLNGCCIKGEVTGAGSVTMDSGTVVLGDVNAGEMSLSGRIRGDLHVTGDSALKSTAVVAGNIYSGTINMVSGARVQGELHITTLESAETAFTDSDFDINID